MHRGADKSAPTGGRISWFIWILGNAPGADNGLSKNKTDDEIGTSTVTPFAALRASSEHIRSAQCKLREGSVALGSEMLRCAQHDRAVIHTDVRIILLICIIGTYGWPD
jgi:hypothetical protein